MQRISLRASGALVTLVGLGLIFPFSAPAGADTCAADERPAATLLLPYFEVDLDNLWGVNTLFEINNASAAPVLAHVVMWTDLSVPVLDFNVYLTGYDIVPISVRNLIEGIFPQTASVGQDPLDDISNQGLFSGDIDLPSCDGQLPLPPARPDFVTHLESSLTGGPSSVLGGDCSGRDLGDRIARGYITVDTVRRCSLQFPGDPGYFVSGGQGEATNDNVLWGNAYYVVDGEDFANATPLVHIEADSDNPETSIAGEATFYGRYVAWTAVDNREPLPSTWAARYVRSNTFSGGTDLRVWRDAKLPTTPFPCGTAPPWFPLAQEGLVIFDEMENPDVIESFPISPQPPGVQLIPFPAEAQRVVVGGADFPVAFDGGWLWLNLNTAVGNNSGPPEDPVAAQSWVGVEMTAEGRFSVGFDAVVLDSGCRVRHDVPTPP